jgi:hypothetical protein
MLWSESLVMLKGPVKIMLSDRAFTGDAEAELAKKRAAEEAAKRLFMMTNEEKESKKGKKRRSLRKKVEGKDRLWGAFVCLQQPALDPRLSSVPFVKTRAYPKTPCSPESEAPTLLLPQAGRFMSP